MIYVTGDTHGDLDLWNMYISEMLNDGDTIIILGDFGIGFFDNKYWTEEMFFDYLAEQNYTVLFLDGNHENFDKLNAYEISEWHGGYVHFIRKNVIHLMRGEIYEIDDKKIFVMGGGYSLDKKLRVPGQTWWPEEMPDEAEYKNALKNLKAYEFKVDYILTHTAPNDTVEYMSHMGRGIKSAVVEELPLNGFLRWIEDSVEYKKWYFGHFHIDAELWKNQYALLEGVRELKTGKLLKMRYKRNGT